ncbi:EscU/YscU/HrcU family type III secretion system export apparatus switch protein [Ralstonia wenshanensis]|uniref:EscU/YscU/HrcU family type III secretion system export apparatus switch protein n=1 Tax=Ralstonia wenshanensis TaxID=2842456 RepID=UPI002AACF09E|nr:EscU/YscU/HrcU family type III secretion system export apparatus switch protein [Ralstonia wenshanensis]MDY7510336.1 EscU/YscU/HrcU family type III secretion system export apparatus switch protein [Ralstonia wenshanensis]
MSEKQHKPTQRRLEDARREGEVVRSTDVTSALVFIGMLVLLWQGGPWLLERMRGLLIQNVTAVAQARDPTAAVRQALVSAGAEWILLSAAVLVLVTVLAVLGAFAQVGGMFAPKRLTPQMSRLNPGEGIQRMFSVRNLIGLAIMLFKVACLALTLFVVIRGSLALPLQAGYGRPAAILAVVAHLVLVLFGWAAVVYVLMAALDYWHVRFEFFKKNRMSTEELRREHRELQGDPHIVGRRRQLALEVQYSALEDRMRIATAIVFSARHAVALYYPGDGTLPMVIAKGSGESVQRIRQMAESHLVPTAANAGLAERLHDTVPMDTTIDRTLFRDVAALLRWAEGADAVGNPYVSSTS